MYITVVVQRVCSGTECPAFKDVVEPVTPIKQSDCRTEDIPDILQNVDFSMIERHLPLSKSVVSAKNVVSDSDEIDCFEPVRNSYYRKPRGTDSCCPHCSMGLNDNGSIDDETRETCDATTNFQPCFNSLYTCGQYYFFVGVTVNGTSHTLCNVRRSCGM